MFHTCPYTLYIAFIYMAYIFSDPVWKKCTFLNGQNIATILLVGNAGFVTRVSFFVFNKQTDARRIDNNLESSA